MSFVLTIPTTVPLKLYAQVKNLTDEQMFVHTSFLKQFAPLPGRSYWLGLRASL